MLTAFVLVDDDTYKCADGSTFQREYGCHPNGEPFNGRWVLRDAAGNFLSTSVYRTDLAEEFNIKLIDSIATPDDLLARASVRAEPLLTCSLAQEKRREPPH